MVKDVHIHIGPGKCDAPETFKEKTAAAGVDGGVVLSLAPITSENWSGCDQRWQSRLDFVLDFTSKAPGFYPFFWLDPTELDAKKQVVEAVKCGIRGFKIIADHFPHEDVLDVYSLIAEQKMPMLFHSGILWTNHFRTAQYNRPMCFEGLSRCSDLTFALAHISWPWNDECLAVYGKFASMRGHGMKMPHMYIDLTPGTPRIYREDALRKLYLTGYCLEHDILWGSDAVANNYASARVKKMIEFDSEIFDRLPVGSEKYLELDCPDYDFGPVKDLAFSGNFEAYIKDE